MYGVPAPKEQFEMVKFPADSQRAGILGQGTFLASTAGPTDTSPTARGIFIRERLLCQHVPPPPPGVITTLPDPLVDQKPKGRRQLMVEHVENPTCASCHRLMDPIGFGFEHFDAIGQYREQEMIPVPGRRGGGGGGGRGGPPPDSASRSTRRGKSRAFRTRISPAPRQLGTILAEQPGVPEMHRPPDVPILLREARNACGREDHRPVVRPVQGVGFKFKSLLVALVAIARVPETMEQSYGRASARR